ncbi:MAG: hypothetical protein GX891_03480 [Clostridiales bacterium]|nr:hypothetical protein [Clostridiales bacterium]
MEVEDKRKQSLLAKIKNIPIIAKIRKIKNIEFIISIFIIAIALLLYSGLQGKNKITPQPDTAAIVLTDTETRLQRILESIDGAGSVDVMISEGENAEIKGVIIVASGAQDIGVRLRLLEAAKTALKVDGSLIQVYTKANGAS